MEYSKLKNVKIMKNFVNENDGNSARNVGSIFTDYFVIFQEFHLCCRTYLELRKL